MNNFTYLGPSGIETWAYYAKWIWFGKTSGFVKPVTDKIRENPKGRFFWEILGFFLGKWFSQYPNTISHITEDPRRYQKTSIQLKEMPVRLF